MTYEENIDALTDAIITTLKEITDFANNCYKGFWHVFDEDDYPNVIVNLERDELRELTAGQDVHNIFYTLVIQIIGTGEPEVDHESLIAIVGEVIDTFQADLTIDGTCSWSKPISTDFAYERGMSLTFYLAAITLTYSNADFWHMLPDRRYQQPERNSRSP